MVGSVTISIELELGWGMHDQRRYDHLSSDRSAETSALKRLLDIADRHKIPLTFNVVGHLLLDSCSGIHEGPLPDNWWAEDPGSDVQTDPLFYAPDMIREIQSRRVDHEFATHTFSHLLADEFSSEHLHHELSVVERVHSEFGLPKPTSIVMPRHQSPNYAVLNDHGIKTIRRQITGYDPAISNPFSKALWIMSRRHPPSDLQQQGGMLETIATPHPSLTSAILPDGQSPPHPVFRAIPQRMRRALHRRYLINAVDTAISSNSNVHLWTHLFNMANEAQLDPIADGLSYLAKQNERGNLSVKRMKDL